MNKLARLALSGAAAGALLVAARPASAWDSICYEYADATKKVADLQFTSGSRGCEGVEAARGRWRDPEHNVDEHRRVLELAIQQAGLPAAVLETVNLPVLANSEGFNVYGANGATPTIAPRTPSGAFRAVYRSYAIDEVAQLPDFSFALWDWAYGNESCPLSPLPNPFDEEQMCHQFSSHMGATNSNHFPPQSDTWFGYYHDLAMSRAAECTATRKAIWNAAPAAGQAGRDGRLAPFFRACEIEALTYEAVAQHFLQDSWSAGHMWQRWGGTHLDYVPDLQAVGFGSAVGIWNLRDQRLRRLLIAEIVAVSAGTIHGSDPVLWEKLFGVTLRDELCYPNADVMGVDNGNLMNFVGDLHLHDVVGGPPTHADISNLALPYAGAALAGQSQRMMGCAAGAVGAVYAALSDPTFGHPVLGAATAMPPAFDVNDCRAPMVTNLAFYQGVDKTDIQPAYGEWQAVLIDDIPGSVESLARNDYGRLRHAAQVLAKTTPNGTEMARLHLTATHSYDDEFCDGLSGVCAPITYTAEPALFTMLQIEPNRCYDAATADKAGCTAPVPPGDPLAPFADAKLVGPITVAEPLTADGAHAVVFHGSRAPQMCEMATPSHFSALKSIVTVANDANLPAACDACAEWTAPFLRIGTGPGDYDTTAEPLCHFTASDPAAVAYEYEPAQGTTDLMALARRHCGCKGLVAVMDAGLQRLVTKPAGSDMKILKTGPTVPIGSLPRDVAAASLQRLLVANGSGQIVGVRNDVEVDLDGAPANGVTRLTFSGVSDIQGITVVNVASKELLLAVTPGTGELIAWDLTSSTQCDRFSVAQVAGQGAYDIVTSADGSTAFVSLRKSAPLSGAVAVISLPAIALCDGSAVGTLQWLTTPGAAAGLGPMAISPDGSKLAVGGRFASTCLDQIKAADGTTNVDTQVGCDRVFVLDVATKTWLQFGTNLSMPTRPGRYPYGVAWFADSVRLAFAAFQGIDNFGQGDSGWPAKSTADPRIPVGGTLRIADTSSASYMGGGGLTPRYWTYNMPLKSLVGGPTVVVDGGANGGPGWVFVGTTSGRISAYPVAVHDATTDPTWEGANADPETAIHMSTNGGWYGGCSHTCSLPGGVCPMVCPGNDNPIGFGYLEMGSNVRVLASY